MLPRRILQAQGKQRPTIEWNGTPRVQRGRRCVHVCGAWVANGFGVTSFTRKFGAPKNPRWPDNGGVFHLDGRRWGEDSPYLSLPGTGSALRFRMGRTTASCAFAFSSLYWSRPSAAPLLGRNYGQDVVQQCNCVHLNKREDTTENTMRSGKDQLGPGDDAAKRTTTLLSVGVRRRRRSLRLEIEAKGQQSDAHVPFMRDFLAPLLAKEFLRQHSTSPFERIFTVNANIPTSGPSHRRDGQ